MTMTTIQRIDTLILSLGACRLYSPSARFCNVQPAGRDSPQHARRRLVRLPSDLVLADRADDLFTLTTLVAGDHDVVVRLGGHDFPLTGGVFHAAETVLVRALAEKRHWCRFDSGANRGIVQGLVSVPEQLLSLLSVWVPIHLPSVPEA